MNPLVSVRLMTYNHQRYVYRALEGIFIQSLPFKIEVVIGDDFSTDDTINIIESFKRDHYNENIEIIILNRAVGDDYSLNRVKHGRLYNFLDILKNCRGKYVALLDGDDYWTSPDKLKSQIEILERNSEIVLCAHDVEIIHDGVESPREKFYPVDVEKDFIFGFADEYRGHFISTVSAVYRNCIDYNEIFFLLNQSFVGDIPLFLLLLSKGKGYFISKKMAVKRRNAGGITFDKERKRLQVLGMYEVWKRIHRIVPNDLMKESSSRLAAYERAIVKSLFKQGAYIKSFIVSIRAILHEPEWLFHRKKVD